MSHIQNSPMPYIFLSARPSKKAFARQRRLEAERKRCYALEAATGKTLSRGDTFNNITSGNDTNKAGKISTYASIWSFTPEQLNDWHDAKTVAWKHVLPPAENLETWEMPKKEKTKGQVESERIEKALEGWPWVGQIDKPVTIAPYALNPDYVFKLPELIQTGSSLLTMMRHNSLVAGLISKYLSEYHSVAWKFGASCREACGLLGLSLDTWQMDNMDLPSLQHDFNYCDHPRFGPDAPQIQSSVAPVVLVTSVRTRRGRSHYVHQMDHIRRMCTSILHFSDFIKNIKFQRVAFLDTNVLAIIIPQMRRLEVLGIGQCQLLSIADTFTILDIIKTDRILERQHSVSLDFSPNYHLGPPDTPYNPYSVGTFGVVWDNINIDTCIATWCLIHRIIPRARKQKCDFESPHSLFYQWAKKGPMARFEETWKAVVDPDDRLSEEEKGVCKDAEELEERGREKRREARILKGALVDARNPDHRGSVERWQRDIGNRPEGWEWAIKDYYCSSCHNTLQGIFFTYYSILESTAASLQGNPLNCLGCRLESALREEKDHYKQQKRDVIRTWLRDPEDGWNRDNLDKALSDYFVRNVEREAQNLDDTRIQDITRGPRSLRYDREWDERQTPYHGKELWRLGGHMRSQTVEGRDRRGGMWDSSNMDARFGHGRWGG